MARIVQRAFSFLDRLALINKEGRYFHYEDLLALSNTVARNVGKKNPISLIGKPIGILCQPGESYVASQWAAWRMGAIAVPLCCDHPLAELEYVIENAGCRALLSTGDLEEKAEEISRSAGISNYDLRELLQNHDVNDIGEKPKNENDDIVMLTYTSGTTGRPKGVPTTENALMHQVEDMCVGWEWHPDDHILHFLPLHHAHGIVAKLCCPFYVGACVEFIDSDANRIIQRISSGFAGPRVTVFMAVPTIYIKLIEAYENSSEEVMSRFSKGASLLRLMVSGSAALPVSVMNKWFEITNQMLLERYGMTEFAMAISNPYQPVTNRIPGYVGRPFKSVSVRIVDNNGKIVPPGVAGNLQISGPTVFKGYWKNPDGTAKEFEGPWFKTGDTAMYDPKRNSYKILGRSSVDIIKTGGYKVSALEIERELLELPFVREATVFGVPDKVFGETIVAVVRAEGDHSEDDIKESLKKKLPKYKIPRSVNLVEQIQKNAMGKVNKKDLSKQYISKG